MLNSIIYIIFINKYNNLIANIVIVSCGCFTQKWLAAMGYAAGNLNGNRRKIKLRMKPDTVFLLAENYRYTAIKGIDAIT